MLGLAAMLILAYGPLQWAFPWWVWVLCIVFGTIDGGHRTKNLIIKKTNVSVK